MPSDASLRRNLAAGALVFAAILAVGAFALRFTAKAPEPAHRFPIAMPAPAAREEPEEEEPAAPEAGPAETARAASDTEALDWLLSIVEDRERGPEAAAVAEEFRKEVMKEPILKEKLIAFRKARTADPAQGKRFLASLSQTPEFRALVARFSAAGHTSAAAILGSPRLALAKPPVFSGPEGARRAASARGARTASGGPAVEGGRQTLFSGAPAGSAERGISGGAAGAAAPKTSPTTSAGASLTGPAAGQPAPSPRPGAEAPKSPGLESHDVDAKLDSDWKDKAVPDRLQDRVALLLRQYPCLENVGKTYVERMIVGNSIEKWGVWGACFSMGIYSRCANAGCGSVAATETCWEACLQVHHDTVRCIGKTLPQSGCGRTAIPDGVWRYYCTVIRDSFGNQTNEPAPYPECAGGGAAPAPTCRTTATVPAWHEIDPPTPQGVRWSLNAITLGETVTASGFRTPADPKTALAWDYDGFDAQGRQMCAASIPAKGADGCYALKRTGQRRPCQ